MGTRSLGDDALRSAVANLCARAERASVTGDQLRARVLLDEAAELAARRWVGRAPVEPAPPIIVVEDNEHVRGAIEALLTMRGHEVLTFADGCAALAHLDAHPRASLVLLDLVMPGMDGWTLGPEPTAPG